MRQPTDPDRRFSLATTTHPTAAARLAMAEVAAVAVGLAAMALLHGLKNRHIDVRLRWELGLLIGAAMAFLTVSLALRRHWSRAKLTFHRENRLKIILAVAWTAGVLGIIIFAHSFGLSRAGLLLGWTELCLVIRGVSGGIRMTRDFTASSGGNPAPLLVASFLLLIAVGTTLLMLPKAYADPEPLRVPFADRFRVALFTATSASCVTGLIVVDTPTHWSRMGQTVILGLIQLGGLGIMTCGAFFAAVAGRSMGARERIALHEMLEAEEPGHVRRLVLGILGFTLAAELVGAVLLWGLFAEFPLGERIFQSVFHAVSAFCNAGFALKSANFVGYGDRWQVWGVICGLVIVGGIGFATLYNLWIVLVKPRFRTERAAPLFNLSPSHARLTLSTRVVLATTGLLLVGGTVAYFLLEATRVPPDPPVPLSSRIAEAWFQSVIFRTAGFNTVDHAALAPATKLLGVMLMFIGAAPGSTGGGIKVTAFALAMLRLASILRGRQRIEVAHRLIPDPLVNRALTVVALGVLVVMATTMLLVIFEHDEAAFLDHLFEATSAFATVGVSAVGTQNLKPESQFVLIVTMFLGRVGPLTLLIGLAGSQKTTSYDYPTERVTLG
jgi:trk system potassium uptake protein TrkH